MPWRWASPCVMPGCKNTTRKGHVCDVHIAEKRRQQDAYRPKAAQRGYDHVWRKTRNALLQKSPLCEYCGGMAELVDHVVPVRYGGTNDDTNLVPCCRRCNARKAVEDKKRYEPTH